MLCWVNVTCDGDVFPYHTREEAVDAYERAKEEKCFLAIAKPLKDFPLNTQRTFP